MYSFALAQRRECISCRSARGRAVTVSSALIASLGMYDFPWTAKANDALWAAMSARLREAGIDAPSKLTRGLDLHQIWRDPNLIFGQTCGYPYVTHLSGKAVLVATPIYAFPGCQGSSHRSVIIAHKTRARATLVDFAGARAAINGRDSNSGMNLFRVAIAPFAQGRPFFSEVLLTGSHEASLAAVSAGAADIAAIDCVSLALLQRGRPELCENVEAIAESPATPALPFIISAVLGESHLGAVRAALFATLKDPALAQARRTAGLIGAEILGDADYERVAQLERDAIAAGYPTLA
jgi:ABC-type phosphate/phosphonate transport system substrate-binding protein